MEDRDELNEDGEGEGEGEGGQDSTELSLAELQIQGDFECVLSLESFPFLY